MFTVCRLGGQRPARAQLVVHARESMISVVRTNSTRVKTVRAPRWVAAELAPACSIEPSFRRIKGCSDRHTLVSALRGEVARRVSADHDKSITPDNYEHTKADAA